MINNSESQFKKCAIILGDSRNILKSYQECADLIITSPPYADARKKHYDSIHPDKFVSWFLTFHQAFWDALKEDGSLVINIKDKIHDGVRHRFVWDTIQELSRLGWYCIEDYIWHKSNPMPGYWPTRLRDGWEYCFHLSKCKRPYMDQNAVRIPVGNWVKSRLQNLGKNDLSRQNSANASGFGRDISKWVNRDMVLPSNVISAPLVGKNKKHPAVFPIELPSFFIKLLSRDESTVIDPFCGSGTTGIAALSLGRKCILIDNNPKYCDVAFERVTKEAQVMDSDVLYAKQKNYPNKKSNERYNLKNSQGTIHTDTIR